MLFNHRFQQALLALLAMDTVTPMETGVASNIAGANAAFAALAEEVGMRVAFAGPGALPAHPDGSPDTALIPLMVQRCYDAQPDFLASQPHLVLELGQGTPEQTLMFNFHMDTVGPHLPVSMTGEVIHGRGTVDNKGPGVALLAALRYLQELAPAVLAHTRILIQVVAGEEGGAMGVYGSRHLAQAGYLGRLNVFVEPSEGGYFDASTTSMTYEVAFDGQGSTDDFPEQGQNATLGLSFIAQHMAGALAQPLAGLGVKMTLAGIHSGEQHNRVYGSGRLLFNFAYADAPAARAAQQAVDAAFLAARSACSERFSGLWPFERTAATLAQVCSARWLKRDLPVLNNRDAAMEAVLATIGLARQTDPTRAFTCDAMWGQGEGRYSIVFGPGSLADNGAHTANEHVSLAELETFTQQVLALILAFANRPSAPAATPIHPKEYHEFS